MPRIRIRRLTHKHRSIAWLAVTLVTAFATASVLAVKASPLPPAVHAALAIF